MTCSRVTQETQSVREGRVQAILTLLSRSATSYVHHNGTEFTRVNEADLALGRGRTTS